LNGNFGINSVYYKQKLRSTLSQKGINITEGELSGIISDLTSKVVAEMPQILANLFEGWQINVQTVKEEVRSDSPQYREHVRRIIADIHSDRGQLEKFLIAEGLITILPNGEWKYTGDKDDVLTFLGDYMDRGIDKHTGLPNAFVFGETAPGIDIVRRIRDLDSQIRRMGGGGYIVTLAGKP